MSKEKISTILVINGPDISAGSNFNLLNKIGRKAPRDVARMTVETIASPTVMPSRGSWSRNHARPATRKAITAPTIPPTKNSLRMTGYWLKNLLRISKTMKVYLSQITGHLLMIHKTIKLNLKKVL